MRMRYRPNRHHRLKRNGINPQRFEASQLKFYAYLIPIVLVTALPIIFIFVNAFKPIDELLAYPPRLFVRQPTIRNFVALFNLSSSTNIPVSRYLINSIISTALVMVGTLFISVSAGYVFSKKKFRGVKTLFQINTVALMFVPTAVAIPRYFVITYTGLYNSFLAHVIPLLAMPVGVFLVKQFIDELPDALIEAAVIDGASDYQILRRIIIPLVKPALATLMILTFQSAWNSSEASSLFITNESLKNFAFYMTHLGNTAGNSIAGQGVGAAAALIMFLPNLVLFIILQSKVMSTMAHSGIK